MKALLNRNKNDYNERYLLYRSHHQRQDCDSKPYRLYGWRHLILFLICHQPASQGCNFSLVTAMDPTEKEPVEKMLKAGIDVSMNASRNTVFFENIYGANQNERKQRVLAKADPFTIQQLEHVDAKVSI